MTIDLPHLAAMDAFGARIAERSRAGDVIALSGPLGSGKTTLARAILSSLGHAGEVPSPSFTILQGYDHLSPGVVHADFYRLEDPEEAVELGLDEYRDGSVLIAEWPEKAGGFENEAACLSIVLEPVGEGRRATVEGGSDWLGRMP